MIPAELSPDLSEGLTGRTIRRLFFVAFAAVLIAIAAAMSSFNVTAAEEASGNFRVSAMRNSGNGPFIYDLTPGRLFRDEITVFNDGSAPAEVILYAADGHTAANGGIAVGTRSASPSALGAWIDIPVDSLLLAPGERQTVPFTLRVPQDAPAYKMAAGIVVESSAPVAVGTGAVSASVSQRSAILVLGTVPGELVTSVAEPTVTVDHSGVAPIIEVGVHNTGSHYVFPAVHVELRNAAGAIVGSSNRKLGMILPGDSLELRMPLASALPAGDYSYVARIDFGVDSVTSMGTFSLGSPEQVFAKLIRAWLIEFADALRLALR